MQIDALNLAFSSGELANPSNGPWKRTGFSLGFVTSLACVRVACVGVGEGESERERASVLVRVSVKARVLVSERAGKGERVLECW